MDQDDIEIERLFNSCDRNGDGAIDINEIAKIMKMMNNDKEPPELEVHEIFKLMDADGNGSIDFNEFRTALRGWRNKKNKRAAHDHGSPKAVRKRTDSHDLLDFFNQYKSVDEISDLHSRLMKENHIDITDEDFIISEALHYGYGVTNIAEKKSLSELLNSWHSDPEIFYEAVRKVIDTLKLPLTEGNRILEALEEIQRWLSIPRIFSTIKERFNYSPFTRLIFNNLVGLDRKYGAPENLIHIMLLNYLRAHVIIEDTNSDSYPLTIKFLTVVLDCIREFILGIRNPNEPEESVWHSTRVDNVRTQSSEFMLQQGVLKELSSIIDKTQFHEVNDKNVSVLIAAINCFSALMERDSVTVKICIDQMQIRTKIMNFYPQAVNLKNKSLLISITSAISIMSGYTQNYDKKTKYFPDTKELHLIIHYFMEFFCHCRSINGYNDSEFFSREVQISIINILKTISLTLPLVEYKVETKEKYIMYIKELVVILKLKSDSFISNSIKAEISYEIMSILYELVSTEGAKGESDLANYFINDHSFMKSIRYQLTLGMDNKMDMYQVPPLTLSFVDLLIKHGDKYNVAKYLGDILLLKLNSPHGRHHVIATLNSLLQTEESKDCLIKIGIVDSFFNIFMKFKSQVLSETRGETVIKLNNSYEFRQLIDITNSLNYILDNKCCNTLFTLDNIETIGLFFIILEVEIINGNIKQNNYDDIDEIVKVIKKLFDKVVKVKSLSNDSAQVKKQCDLIYTGLVDKIKSAKEQAKSRHEDNDNDMELDAQNFPKLDRFFNNGVISSNDDFKCILISKWNPSEKNYCTLPRKVNFVELVDFCTQTYFAGSTKTELQYKIPTMNDTYHTIAANEFEEFLEISIKSPPHDIVKLYIKQVDSVDKPPPPPSFLKSAAEIKREFDLNHPGLSISTSLLNKLVSHFQSHNYVELNENQFCDTWKSIIGTDDEKTLADAKSLFRAFDIDKNGGLSVQEILIGLTKLMKGTDDEKIVIAFNAYDLDGNKKLDYDELVSMIVLSNHPKYSWEVAQAFSKQAYTHLMVGHGIPIDFEQFRKCVLDNKIPLGSLFINELDNVRALNDDELERPKQLKNTKNLDKNNQRRKQNLPKNNQNNNQNYNQNYNQNNNQNYNQNNNQNNNQINNQNNNQNNNNRMNAGGGGYKGKKPWNANN